jgi:TusA-related sulfurtransferase
METNSSRLIEFDICGQICPASLLVALRELNNYSSQLTDGTVTLLFKTDNRDGIHTIPTAASNMGFKVDVQRNERYYTITIAKS